MDVTAVGEGSVSMAPDVERASVSQLVDRAIFNDDDENGYFFPPGNGLSNTSLIDGVGGDLQLIPSNPHLCTSDEEATDVDANAKHAADDALLPGWLPDVVLTEYHLRLPRASLGPTPFIGELVEPFIPFSYRR